MKNQHRKVRVQQL